MLQYCLIMSKTARNTPAKTKIYELLRSSEVALSHTEIQQQLDSAFDRVTIYRVLDRLVEAGQIHKIVNVDGVVKYAGCKACTTIHQDNHIHFSCERCKRVTCLDEVAPVYQLPKNYRVTETSFTLLGVCPQCS